MPVPSRNKPSYGIRTRIGRHWKQNTGSCAQSGCSDIRNQTAKDLAEAGVFLQKIAGKRLDPNAPEFADLERKTFEAGPLVSGCNIFIPEYIRLITQMRDVVKKQSEHWDMNSDAPRITLYRLLYGGRTAIEEIMLQIPQEAYPVMIQGRDEPSQTPAADRQAGENTQRRYPRFAGRSTHLCSDCARK